MLRESQAFYKRVFWLDAAKIYVTPKIYRVACYKSERHVLVLEHPVLKRKVNKVAYYACATWLAGAVILVRTTGSAGVTAGA